MAAVTVPYEAESSVTKLSQIYE